MKSNDFMSQFDSIKFNQYADYPELSISLKGKPLVKIGQKKSEFNSDFSFSEDPNGIHYKSQIITDYYSTDSDFSVHCNTGLNGVVYFSSENQNDRIIAFSGSWSMQNSDDNFSCSEISQLFPILKNEEFYEGWKKNFDSEFQTEYFSLKRGNISNESNGWVLNYEVRLK